MPHVLGEVWQTVERLAQVGLSLIPIRPDQSKRPALHSWKEYQSRTPSPLERSEWWANSAGNGIALICGTAAARCEALDFDKIKSFHHWRDLLTGTEGGKALFQRLAITRTPGPGIQVIYRSEEPVPGNQRLARRPKEEGGWEVLIETRGAGGYCIIPPTPAACHPKQRPYEMLRGDLAALPVLGCGTTRPSAGDRSLAQRVHGSGPTVTSARAGQTTRW
jgi:putative DNA primase/helicase